MEVNIPVAETTVTLLFEKLKSLGTFDQVHFGKNGQIVYC